MRVDTSQPQLARHFGWALEQIFDKHGMTRVMILEDDLEVRRRGNDTAVGLG